MKRAAHEFRADALAIWRAALEAVSSERLMSESVRVEARTLWIADEPYDLDSIGRIVVVGAGKAGSGMAAGLERALGQDLLEEKHVEGWINVPADCVRPLQRVHLHAARPAGVNEPTPEGVAGAEAILRLVRSLGPDDLCLCLISGGGSALLPAPADGITLADKRGVTRFLSAAGANIEELNTVRKQLSRVKGGRLAAACGAGRMVTLIISDVIGDRLDVIASGPTVADTATAADALAVLERFDARRQGVPQTVFDVLQAASHAPLVALACQVRNVVIGNNARAVDAAGIEAERRGYSHAMLAAVSLEGPAEDVGAHLADMALRMRRETGPDCLITGGEPTVLLVAEQERGLGGRNQQLVLAALERLLENGSHGEGIAILSGGTDGEDGPTDAAGAIVDEDVFASMATRGLIPGDFLRRNDAYRFFDALDALIHTGPTHTNVCDVRVVVVERGA